MKYKFILHANYQSTTDKNNNVLFMAGETYDIDETLGNAFVKRGAAIPVDDDYEIENIDLADALAEIVDDDDDDDD